MTSVSGVVHEEEWLAWDWDAWMWGWVVGCAQVDDEREKSTPAGWPSEWGERTRAASAPP